MTTGPHLKDRTYRKTVGNEVAHTHHQLDELQEHAGTAALNTTAEEVDRDEEKELLLQNSFSEAIVHEGALIQEALLQSKTDAQGILNSDWVVILRMTRMARSPLVRSTLLEHPMLEECRMRVRGANCEITPDFAAGAIAFVPLTPESVVEIEEVGFELRDHNIVALSSDINLIKLAFQQIPHKVRPRVANSPSHRQDVGEGVAGGEIARRGQNPDDEDRITPPQEEEEQETHLEFIIETILPTDTSCGFPVWQS